MEKRGACKHELRFPLTPYIFVKRAKKFYILAESLNLLNWVFKELIANADSKHRKLLAVWKALNELRPFLVDTKNSVAKTFAQMTTQIHEVNVRSQSALHKMALRLSYEKAFNDVNLYNIPTSIKLMSVANPWSIGLIQAYFDIIKLSLRLNYRRFIIITDGKYVY